MSPRNVREELDRVLSSRAFADSERHRQFLRFVVEQTLDGRASEIKESVIGVEALGRNGLFDPKADPIVRVEAGRLRARLSSYYESEGKGDPIRIELPKGGYVPEFTSLDSAASHSKGRARMFVAGLVLGAVITLLLGRLLQRGPAAAGEVRLCILPPDHTAVESSAISPDGHWVAFTAASNRRPALWVRALDSTVATPISGTEDASAPFWSPDSQSIAFFSHTKVNRVEVTGGPVQVITPTQSGVAGSWSRQGIILFAMRHDGGNVLYQVPATGGTPKQVTSLDESRGEYSHGYPQFLPDGRHFLYLASSRRPRETAIRAGSLDGGNSKLLTRSEASGAYAPPTQGRSGMLLYIAGGKVIAQQFDPPRLEMRGPPLEILSGIRYSAGGKAHFSVSNDGVLAYQGGSAKNQQLAWLDRDGRPIQEVGPPNDWVSFQLSPDERRIVFQRSDPETGVPSLWAMELNTGAVSRLLSPSSSGAEYPVWSPNGTEVAYAGAPRLRAIMRVHDGDANASPLVADEEGAKIPSDWSSDGRWFLYSSPQRGPRNLNLWLVPIGFTGQTDKPRPYFVDEFYSDCAAYFAPAPPGQTPRWIAHMTNAAGSGRFEVYVRDFPSGQQKWQVSNQGGWLPHWRRDGKELFYLADDGTLMAVPVNAGATFEHGAPLALFRTGLHQPMAAWPNVYAVSRDGTRFLLNQRLTEPAVEAISIVLPRRP
jgi:Tol biopolymer transport system component